MSVIAAYMVPHPPMIVPDVGQGDEKRVSLTVDSYDKVARQIAQYKPDTIVISSPHTVMYGDYFHISPGRSARGSFARFRAPGVKFDVDYDTELVSRIEYLADREDIAAGTLGEKDAELDHGVMVPLYFINKYYTNYKLVRIGLSGLPLNEHYRLGMKIAQAAEELDRRVIYVGSGDLSHKLQTYGPYGYAPEGPEYDKRIMDVCGRAAFEELFDFDESFCDKAAECGHRSFVMMAGALDGKALKTTCFSHEDVTGVGYGICSYEVTGTDSGRHFLDSYLNRKRSALDDTQARSDAYVQLARRSLEHYIRTGSELMLKDCEDIVLPEMRQTRAGAFVSIHEHGRLRGCIGTILPTTGNLAEEILQNAVSASTRDPRFDPIEESELPWLEINVDVLSEPEPIDSEDKLNPKKYGVIVTNGYKRGLLLPDLDGVDTIEEQISIARRKGGIGDKEPVKLERFTVTRHV